MDMKNDGGFKVYEWFNYYLSDSIPKDLPDNWLDKFIYPDGALTESGAHDFCYRKRLPREFIVALSALYENSKAQISGETLTWLLKCRLISEDHEITQLGIVKLAESYPLAKQVDFLELPMKVICAPRDPILSTEENAIKNIEGDYVDHLILHDEGGKIGTVFYICILANCEKLLPHTNMANFSMLNNRKYLIGLDAWSFDSKSIEFVCEEINQMDAEKFRDGYEFVKTLYGEAEQSLDSRGLSLGSNFYLRLFNSFGTELICDLLRLRVNRPFLSFPDLTIVGQSGISFVEVKAKDKLSFNQIYTFILLKELRVKHRIIADLALVKMIFNN